ncbi:MAG: hypothetical protein KDA96_16345 [Planctomycetaceae bacterium]|nr:hypothetical protein [Planctomycetaceae bacterium]
MMRALAAWIFASVILAMGLPGAMLTASADEGGSPAADAPANADPAPQANLNPYQKYYLDQQKMTQLVRSIDAPLLPAGADKEYERIAREFRDLMRAGASTSQADRALIRQGFALRLFKMTDRAFIEDQNAVRNLLVNEISRDLAGAGRDEQNQTRRQKFREAVCQELHGLLLQMMENNLDARTFAITLFSDLEIVQQTGGIGRITLLDDVYKSLTQLLEDQRQPDTVRSCVAVEMREILLKVEVTPLNQMLMAKALAAELRRPYTVPDYRMVLIDTVCEITTPREVVAGGAKKPLAMEILVEVMSDQQNQLTFVRCHAAAGLGRVGYDNAVNFDPLAWKVTQLALQAAVEFNTAPSDKWGQAAIDFLVAFHHLDSDGLKGANKQGMLNRAETSAIVKGAYPHVLEILKGMAVGRPVPPAVINDTGKWLHENTPADGRWDSSVDPLKLN